MPPENIFTAQSVNFCINKCYVALSRQTRQRTERVEVLPSRKPKIKAWQKGLNVRHYSTGVSGYSRRRPHSNGRKARLAPNLAPANDEPFDQILTPERVGELVGRDRHTLANWAKRGLLVAVRTGADGKRITGFTASSVRALLAGKATMNGKAVA